MATPTELGGRAYEFVADLVRQIGPRPAGKAAEAQARDFIEAALESWGYEVQRTPIQFAPIPRFYPIYPLAGFLLAVGSWFVTVVPWLVILLPLLGTLLPEITIWTIQRRPRTAYSENLHAYLGEKGPGPTLILCAHVDTAPASGFRSALGLALQGRWFNIFQRMAIALAAVAALSWIGFTIPFILLNLIRVFGTLTGAWLLMSEAWRQLGGRGDYSPGAVDNASGVGLLLAMAEQFAEMPPEGLRPGFLFTGAEETGMHGARSFASGLEPGQKDQLFVLNVDMVGAGDVLRVVTSEGIIKKRLTDPRLNRILFEAAPAARRAAGH